MQTDTTLVWAPSRLQVEFVVLAKGYITFAHYSSPSSCDLLVFQPYLYLYTILNSEEEWQADLVSNQLKLEYIPFDVWQRQCYSSSGRRTHTEDRILIYYSRRGLRIWRRYKNG